MNGSIHPFTMPKWGLTMERGTLTAWHKNVGDRIEPGMEVCDVETEKIANGVESPVVGWLRRRVANAGDVLPVGALLGIIADQSATDEEIDEAVRQFQEAYVAHSAEEGAVTGTTPELIEVAGRRVRHLIQRGPGDAVILVHGFGSNLESWLLNHGALAAAGRTVAALDLPGHGESQKQVDSGSLEELAAAVLAYMDAIGVETAHLIGHSLGAAVCLEAARHAGSRVKSLTLVAPAGLVSPVNRDFIHGFIGALGRKDLKPVLQLLFADESLITRQFVEDSLKYKRLEGVTEALSRIASAVFDGGAAGAEWREVVDRVPTLVIWGGRDAVIPAPDPKEFDGTRIAYHLLPQYGHVAQFEAAAEVNRLIDEFVGR
jgi:pyruvate dehydrogenase E2 component (dihydrolipoamide acetyltransferase)